jgi:hypothetical protein
MIASSKPAGHGLRWPKVFSSIFREVLNQPDGLHYLETVLKYIAQSTDKLDDTTLQAVVQRALPEIGDTLMPTIAETWEERGLQKGLEKGLEKGRQEEIAHLHANLLDILEIRFGTVPEALTQYIKGLDDLTQLRKLSKIAATAASLEAFRERSSH